MGDMHLMPPILPLILIPPCAVFCAGWALCSRISYCTVTITTLDAEVAKSGAAS
jgi:hypothetical protein